MSTILLKNGRIWNGEDFHFADVYIEEGKIVEIAPCIGRGADKVYDVSGKIVSAGLVDCHVHMQGISPERFGVEAEPACFPFGVTATADAAGENGDKALLDSFAVKSKVFVCAEVRNNRADFTKALKMLEKYGERVVGVKLYFDTQASEVSDVSALKDVVEFAAGRQLIVMVHTSNSPIAMPEMLSVMRKGDIVTHAYHGGPNNVSEDGFACVRQAKERGVIIDVGMAGHVHTDFGIFVDAIRAGAKPHIISTDITKWSSNKRGGRYGMTMCMSIARDLGMDEKEIFEAVTVNPARALGQEAQWGRLEVGRCADVTVLDYREEPYDLTDKAGNHIYSSTGYVCDLTIVNGEIVYEGAR